MQYVPYESSAQNFNTNSQHNEHLSMPCQQECDHGSISQATSCWDLSFQNHAEPGLLPLLPANAEDAVAAQQPSPSWSPELPSRFWSPESQYLSDFALVQPSTLEYLPSCLTHNNSNTITADTSVLAELDYDLNNATTVQQAMPTKLPYRDGTSIQLLNSENDEHMVTLEMKTIGWLVIQIT